MLQAIDWVNHLPLHCNYAGHRALCHKKGIQLDRGVFSCGRHFPWYILGLVGMATYVDMSGTMFQVSYFYLLVSKDTGWLLKGVWLCFLPSSWCSWRNGQQIRLHDECRSDPDSFGHGMQGQIARLISAITVLILVVCFLGYFFVGTAKFLPIYIPLKVFRPMSLRFSFS